jgi:hypothetical protein
MALVSLPDARDRGAAAGRRDEEGSPGEPGCGPEGQMTRRYPAGFFFRFGLVTRPLWPPVTNICTSVPSRPRPTHA